MKVRRLFNKLQHGEKGFTLIELLVVVAILGIIAAVVVLNIGGFMGKGKVESANTEAHQVETAVIAYMVASNLSDFDGDVGPTSTSPGPVDYLTNKGSLQATYTFTNANITGAALIANSKWTGLSYTVGTGWVLP